MDFSAVPQEGMVPAGGMVPPMAQMPEDGSVPEDASLVPGQNGLVEHYDEELYQQGEFVEVKNFMVDGGDRFGVSAVAFDGQEELLWMGNQGGHVTSYHSLDLHKYTSFQMHETNEVRQMLTIDQNIFSLTSDSLRCWSKFGRPQFTYMSSATQDMQCMLVTGPGSILMGGHQPLVVELDIESHTEIRQVQVGDPGCAIFRYSSQYICTGDTGGKAHSGTLSDFDVHANQLVTCGFVKRMGNLTCDRFLMVYDLRLLRPMTPMQAQTEGTHITSFDMSPSNQVMAFGDAGGEDPFVSVPKRYRKVEIKYSKLGVEDFDFRHYNKTNFAGLETHIPNAYCNSMLQASNFLRAFRTIPEASALGLVLGDAEESMGKANLPRLIQNWSRFIVQQIHAELVEARKVQAKQKVEEEATKQEPGADTEDQTDVKTTPSSDTEVREEESVIRRLFGVYIENKFTCKCGESSKRDTCSHLIDLSYPDTTSSSRSHGKSSVASLRAETPQQHTFASVVERSLSQEVNTQAWCTRCEKYQPHEQVGIFYDAGTSVDILRCRNRNKWGYLMMQEQVGIFYDAGTSVDILRCRNRVVCCQLHAKSAAEDPNRAANNPPPARAFVKPCRYGEACTRKFCKFGHGDERDTQLEVVKPYLEEGVSEFAWVPLGLRLKLLSNGKVKINNLSDEVSSS
ncbi:hypothetical protein NP493_254g03006 [Ridgeia piscesae]|uniref:Uncharacterized protein n=1 Tax=Ridgeia piscesae TaxID=27915 RepID=A0AAD9UCT8_RIDPI|nr:hypothetical protein NP493_254g03006 [Ridgeia piscesae]